MQTTYTSRTTINIGHYQHVVEVNIWNCRRYPRRWSWKAFGQSGTYLISIERTKGREKGGPFKSVDDAMKDAERHGIVVPQGFYEDEGDTDENT